MSAWTRGSRTGARKWTIHRAWLSAILLTMAAPTLTGCATDGAAPAINSTGPALTNPGDGPAQDFYNAERTALNNDTPENAKSMYQAGYTLIYFNCNEYFDSAGKTQSILIASRDAVGAIGAVSTSVLVLTNAPKSALAAVGIGSGAAYAGIDTYTKDFLFSAENVDAVRSLVSNALDTHHKAVLASFGAAQAQIDYTVALVQLRDEQTICTLRHIAALATDAIKNGHLVATTNTLDSDVAGLNSIQDNAVLSALGTIMQTSRSLTVKEAGALWEIVKDAPKDPQRLTTLETMLSSIPTATSPFDGTKTGTLKASWIQEADVEGTLQKFSQSTQTAFVASIIASTDQQKKQQTVANSVALVAKIAPQAVPVPEIPFQLGSNQSSVLTGRIDVRAH